MKGCTATTPKARRRALPFGWIFGLLGLGLHGVTQAAPSDWLTLNNTTVTGLMGLTSNYKFRGVDTGSGDAAVFGALTAARKSGAYATLWASSNGDADNGSEYRLRLGYATRLDVIAGLDATLDVHATDYVFTGSPQDFYEIGAQLSANNFWRPRGVGYAGLAVSNDYFNSAGASIYGYAGYTQPIQATRFNGLAEIGVLKTDKPLWPAIGTGAVDTLINHRLGVQTAISGVEVSATYEGIIGKKNNCPDDRCKGAGVLTLRKLF